MPNCVTLVVGVGETERLAQDLRRGTNRPGLVTPQLHLDLYGSTEVAEGLLPNGGDDRVEERRPSSVPSPQIISSSGLSNVIMFATA